MDISNQYFSTYGWMLDLGLDRRARDIYAIIYGYQQSSYGCYLLGDLDHLITWTESTYDEVKESLSELLELGLISVKRKGNTLAARAIIPEEIQLLDF